MVKKAEKTFLIDFIHNNTQMSRRQACQVGASFGLGLCLSVLSCPTTYGLGQGDSPPEGEEEGMKLMQPIMDGKISVERAICERRTIRSFRKEPITSQQFSQILWSAQGITDRGGFKRAAPSGGALYPADLYAVTGEEGVDSLTAGVYHYEPEHHMINKVGEGDCRKSLAAASLSQMWMADAPVLMVICLEYKRITDKYGERGERYALIEAGHIGQNIFLQCQALGLSAGIVGAFSDGEVSQTLGAKREHEPILIMPVGRQS